VHILSSVQFVSLSHSLAELITSAIFGNPIHSKSIPSSSFYTEAEPPFVHAMASSLHEAGVRNRRLPGTGWMFGKANQQYKDDIALQHRIADEVSCRRHTKT
jgi:hypothetical protein